MSKSISIIQCLPQKKKCSSKINFHTLFHRATLFRTEQLYSLKNPATYRGTNAQDQYTKRRLHFLANAAKRLERFYTDIAAIQTLYTIDCWSRANQNHMVCLPFFAVRSYLSIPRQFNWFAQIELEGGLFGQLFVCY